MFMIVRYKCRVLDLLYYRDTVVLEIKDMESDSVEVLHPVFKGILFDYEALNPYFC